SYDTGSLLKARAFSSASLAGGGGSHYPVTRAGTDASDRGTMQPVRPFRRLHPCTPVDCLQRPVNAVTIQVEFYFTSAVIRLARSWRGSAILGIIRWEGRALRFPCGQTTDYIRFLSRAESLPQRRVNLYSLTVANKSLLLEPIHERINSRPRGPYHFCENCVS